MEHDEQTELNRERTWLLVSLGVLAAVVGLVAAFVLGLSVGDDVNEHPPSPGQHLEAWNRCLAEAGAVVPEVEARDDGGFTITVTAGFFEEFDPQAFFGALAQCERLAPDGLLAGLGQIAGLQFNPRSDRPLPGVPHDLNRRELAEVCERLLATDRLPEDVPEGLLKACEALHD